MSQVIIVSNRLPISVSKEDGQLIFTSSVGGLATGLSSYVKKRNNLWIGWPGIASNGLSDEEKDKIVSELAKHRCIPVFLNQKQIDDFYNGYSNRVLWPIFHNLKLDKIDQAEYARYWAAYRQVNRKFADAVLENSDSNIHIWVHDYQLLLVPEMLRKERDDAILGFFLHIPWPEPSQLKKVEESKLLEAGILGADVAGFHTPKYVKNFLDSARVQDYTVLEGNEVLLNNRSVRVANFPMGIDYEKYAQASKTKSVQEIVKGYRKQFRHKKIIVSVDRLDPSKGLVEKLTAYKLLLERYPKFKSRVVYIMVTAPSRLEVPAYKRLSKRLGQKVAEINNILGTAQWQPIYYIDQSQSFEEVTALFQIADVAFITPLKDGMNLAAKEYIASNNRSGALILSETAGAAEELSDALIVNPTQPDTMVEALKTGLTMHRRELRRRLNRMQDTLAGHTVQDWAKDFIDSLNKPINPSITLPIRTKQRQEIVNNYRLASKHLFLLDYDGTLVGFKENFEDAKPPKSLLRLLERLGANPASDVVLISGRSSNDLNKWFGTLPINLIAEHGASFKAAASPDWATIEKVNSDWKKKVLPVLEQYTELTPGARIEVKPHSLVWHYRAASPYYASKHLVLLKRLLKPYQKRYALDLMQGNKNLEIKNSLIGKGSAAKPWLHSNYDFVLAIGDDATDEDLFASIGLSTPKRTTYTIKVGRGKTKARYRAPNHDDAVSLLNELI